MVKYTAIKGKNGEIKSVVEYFLTQIWYIDLHEYWLLAKYILFDNVYYSISV